MQRWVRDERMCGEGGTRVSKGRREGRELRRELRRGVWDKRRVEVSRRSSCVREVERVLIRERKEVSMKWMRGRPGGRVDKRYCVDRHHDGCNDKGGEGAGVVGVIGTARGGG